jgi:RIO kinase 1
MVHKRKSRREYSKDLKTFRGVFDNRTLMVLYKLLEKNKIYVESMVKEGKESVVLVGSNGEGKHFAIKVFRTGASSFNAMWKYLIGDPRFQRVRKNRRHIVKEWAKREFKNTMIAFKAGVACPSPVDYSENILILDFIGKDSVPAPMMLNVDLENPGKDYEAVLKNMEKLAKTGLVHGDLSAYNILYLKKPILIDFSHGTTSKNPLFKELLMRDIKNINAYFSKLIAVKSEEKLFNDLIKHFKDK